MTDHLAHFGIKRKSGRYPWGSGKRPYQGASASNGTTRSGSGKRPYQGASASNGTTRSGFVKDFSDDELKEAINRLKMEKEYLSLQKDIVSSYKEKNANNREKFERFLNTTSTALKVGSGAIALIGAVKKLKGTGGEN